MNVIDRNRVWKNLKQRLALRRMGCCGTTTSAPPTATSAPPTIIETLNLDNRNLEDDQYNVIRAPSISQVEDSGVNLAMALAAERNFRLSNIGTRGFGKVKTLVSLIEETDGVYLKKARKRGWRIGADSAGGGDYCCVCMERNKGAAFIPCGHTFCRVCSRELWLNRGSCPICNCSITEILHIF